MFLAGFESVVEFSVDAVLITIYPRAVGFIYMQFLFAVDLTTAADQTQHPSLHRDVATQSRRMCVALVRRRMGAASTRHPLLLVVIWAILVCQRNLLKLLSSYK